MSAARIAIGALAHGPAIALSLLTLVLVGQPIYANDTWIHLALGDAYLSGGPHLSADPALFAAPGPPQPSAWLGAALMSAVLDAGGFAGLRVLHVLLVAGMGVVVWRFAARSLRSRWSASAVLVGFVLLSTWRLVQLRPDLFTLLATLLLYPLLIEPREGPGRKRMMLAAGLGIIWANVHAAFLLGPLLVLGVALSLFALEAVRFGLERDPRSRTRAWRLLVAGLVLLAATLFNPLGPAAHLAYFQAGEGTLVLGAVTDEWAPTHLLALPPPNRPPTWPAWVLSWLSLAAVIAGAVRILKETRSGRRSAGVTLDPGLYALAVAGLAAGLLATRFLWMEVFALVVGAGLLTGLTSRVEATWLRSRGLLAVSLAVLGSAAITLHVRTGDWPLVARSLIANASSYGSPYYPARFNGFAVSFLADGGLEGRIYNPYPIGGFMSFWLAPRLMMSSSGTMNVEQEAMQDFLAIAERTPRRAGESFAALLDRHDLDLFLGTGLPIELIPGRRGPAQVAHLEAEPGWMLVYRSLRSAVYLRRSDRNRANLDRVAAYYERAGVFFDREQGLDVGRVLAERPDWAVAQGLVPRDFTSLVASVSGVGAATGRVAISEAHRLAMIYATLGLYERALATDAPLRGEGLPGRFAAMRRSLLCLLHLGRDQEALGLARALDAPAERASGRSPGWVPLVRSVSESAPDDRAASLAQMPLYRSEAVDQVLEGLAVPEPRDPSSRMRRTRAPGAVDTPP